MHPKFAERIASNLMTVQAKMSRDEAIRWWTERFGHITPEEFVEVQEALTRLARKR